MRAKDDGVVVAVAGWDDLCVLAGVLGVVAGYEAKGWGG